MAKSGMEMMLQNMLKAAGFDMGEVTANITQFAEGVKTTLTNIDGNMKHIAAQNDLILKRQEKILAKLGITEDDVPASADSPRLISSQP